ncbi:hypothetical protein VQ643_05965 [Pseudomonas sp. F1_0610]|uniref:hypothetical protein n=1 Tax=Pseudomonas sp. F1_0610 TaxID=3114284 RepID=UPI0039C055EE
MYCTHPELGGKVIIFLNARLTPNDCEQLKDVCSRFIQQENKTIELTQAKVIHTDIGEPTGCEFYFEVDNLDDRHINFIIQIFTSTLAPKGSKISIFENSTKDCKQAFFGSQEGLALYLNGTDLPNEIYKKYSALAVFEECDRLLQAQNAGNVCSIWQGPTETALYMYGNNFTIMHESIEPCITAYPLCQKSRLATVA